MADPMDRVQELSEATLRAVMAKRTPGEWTPYDDTGFCVGAKEPDGTVYHVADVWEKCDQAAIVAAVNACGPLLERVRMLESLLESHKARCMLGSACKLCQLEPLETAND